MYKMWNWIDLVEKGVNYMIRGDSTAMTTAVIQ